MTELEKYIKGLDDEKDIEPCYFYNSYGNLSCVYLARIENDNTNENTQ